MGRAQPKEGRVPKEKFTLRERRVAAYLAEHNGNPDTFPIEGLGASTIAMVRRKIEEELGPE